MNEDLKQLQGTWRIATLEIEGQTMSAASLGGAQITVKGERFISTGMGAAYEGKIEIDASSNPKALDLKFDTGPEKGNTNAGIYELNGDTWRLCLNTRGKKRPEKFAAVPGTGIAVEVLQRGAATNVAEVAPPELDNVRFEPAPELAGEWSMVSGSLDGHALDKRMVKSGRRVVNGSDMTVMFGSNLHSKAKYTVDRSQTPAAIDIYNTAGGNAGTVQYGIYQLEGKLLKLSIAAPGRDRPADFTSSQGDGRTVVVWTAAGR